MREKKQVLKEYSTKYAKNFFLSLSTDSQKEKKEKKGGGYFIRIHNGQSKNKYGNIYSHQSLLSMKMKGV